MTNTGQRTITYHKGMSGIEDACVTTKYLPESFMISMRKLFDILDSRNVGLVPISEIELRWREDAVPNLPGVLDSLRSIVPADGLLNFETFVWGLKIALAKARKNGHSRISIASQPLEKIPSDKAENCINKQRKSCSVSQKPLCAVSGSFNKKSRGCNVVESRNGYENDGKQSLDDAPITECYFDEKINHRRSISSPVRDSELTANDYRTFHSLSSHHITSSAQTRNGTDKINKSSATTEQQQITENLEKIKLDVSAGTVTPEQVKSGLLKQEPKCKSTFKSIPVDIRQAAAKSNQKDQPEKLAETLHLNQNRGQTKPKHPISLAGKLIGISGSVHNDKQVIIYSQYGSLKRPALSTPYKCISTDLKIRTSPIKQSVQNTRKNNYVSPESINLGTCSLQDNPTTKRSLFLNEPATKTHDCAPKIASSAIYTTSRLEKVEKNGLLSDVEPLLSETEMKESRRSEKTHLSNLSFFTLPQLSTPPPSARIRKNEILNPTSQYSASCLPYAAFETKRNRAEKPKEQRRHTVASGVNYHMLKYIKILNDEKRLLGRGMRLFQSGLSLFERCFNNLEQQSNYIALNDHCSNHPTNSMLTNENLELLTGKMKEITELIEEFSVLQIQRAGQRATTTPNSFKNNCNLKEQIEALNKETAMQRTKIIQLEREKSLIIQQLFHAKSQLQLLQPTSKNPSIFI